MLKLSRKTMLAIEAVLDVAYNARPDPVQSKDITRRQGIPQRYLEQVMQSLVHRNILKGVRGPKGGYTLARERRKISVGDVVRVVEQLEIDVDGDPVSEADLGEKVVAPLWAELHEAMLDRLDRISMEDLCRRARELDIPHGTKQAPDFTI